LYYGCQKYRPLPLCRGGRSVNTDYIKGTYFGENAAKIVIKFNLARTYFGDPTKFLILAITYFGELAKILILTRTYFGEPMKNNTKM